MWVLEGSRKAFLTQGKSQSRAEQVLKDLKGELQTGVHGVLQPSHTLQTGGGEGFQPKAP